MTSYGSWQLLQWIAGLDCNVKVDGAMTMDWMPDEDMKDLLAAVAAAEKGLVEDGIRECIDLHIVMML